METRPYTASAPGRICLFGEHQDYLGLPVISAAVGLRLSIDVTLENPVLCRYRIIMPDLGSEDLITTAMPIVYQHDKDYYRSALKVLRSEGIEPPRALTAVVSSQIPIAAGTSSSSALVVAWIAALLHAADRKESLDPLRVGRWAHRAEVLEFRESGGWMDQLTIACGGICHIDFEASEPITSLPGSLKGLVLADSCQPKDTQAILGRVRNITEGAMNKIRSEIPDFDLRSTPLEKVKSADLSSLSKDEQAVLLGNLRNRDILLEGREHLSKKTCNLEILAGLLNEHHAILRDALGISTPKVEAMLEAARKAGALGGKINGSGGGGCLFVLAPGCEAEVAQAMKEADGEAWPVEVADGVRIL
ncbi:MAG: mevalonate kinase family protein [Planctomycetota bacterium]|jgi:galactokinase